MTGATRGAAAVRLFDAHCHLQDPKICSVAPRLIHEAQESGVLRFAVNGVSERDWHLVKQMSEQYPGVIPCFGLHPWYVEERSPNWLSSMREFFNAVPCAAVGETGLDKGSHGKGIEFMVQVQVFREQLQLAKELERPVSIHCVRAFGDLLSILQSDGPFPAGLILHSYLGSAEMVPAFAKHGSYFSFSGYLTTMKPQKAKKMLKMVPIDRILLESDAPDGLPRLGRCSLSWVPGDASIPQELQMQTGETNIDTSTLPKEMLNHPVNISSEILMLVNHVTQEKGAGGRRHFKLHSAAPTQIFDRQKWASLKTLSQYVCASMKTIENRNHNSPVLQICSASRG